MLSAVHLTDHQQHSACAHRCSPRHHLSLCAGATLPGPGQLALAVAVAAAVTVARAALLAAWPEFKEASDRSNQQVSVPLPVVHASQQLRLPA